jgi:hypothetical protein
MTREIPLPSGHVALVDDGDYELVMASGPWHANKRRHGFTCKLYAQRSVRKPSGGWTSQKLHTFLMGCSPVDHINGDGLDNRRCNLRPATASQNNRNARRRQTNLSGFKGVSSGPGKRRWRARIQIDGRIRQLGYYDTAEAAAVSYDVAAREAFGEFAHPNFPSLGVD